RGRVHRSHLPGGARPAALPRAPCVRRPGRADDAARGGRGSRQAEAMTRPRIVVCAYSDVGHACLEHLLEQGANVVAVYTHADAAGEEIWFRSVGQLAHERGVPVYVDRDLTSIPEIERLESLAPDLLFSFYFRHMLPPRVLAAAPLGAYNMHGSLLPKYRGRAPVNWAVLHGETETGATLHVMTARPDAGDIVDAERVPIGEDDTAAMVQQRVTHAAVQVLA